MVMQDRVRRRVEQARRQRFERLVARTLDDLPARIVLMLDNVEIIVEDEPTDDQLTSGRGYAGPAEWQAAGDDQTLFGLYEGTPLTQRGSDYHLVLPDRITVFRGPLERACQSPQAIAREVRITILHELGHHLGLDEEQLTMHGLA
jgi:predicted Zn-dependent protease with MMP-like domain